VKNRPLLHTGAPRTALTEKFTFLAPESGTLTVCIFTTIVPYNSSAI
jgi:hypothetical protein